MFLIKKYFLLFSLKISPLLLTLLMISLSTFSISAETVTYDYDALGRLINVVYPDGSDITYTYDDAGNRLEVSKEGGDSGGSGGGGSMVEYVRTSTAHIVAPYIHRTTVYNGQTVSLTLAPDNVTVIHVYYNNGCPPPNAPISGYRFTGNGCELVKN